jgi:hypothetical protein
MTAPHVRSFGDQDGGVLLDSSRDAITTIDATGAFVWERLKAGKSVDQVISELSIETHMDREIVRRDVENFVRDLQSRDLLVDSDAHQRPATDTASLHHCATSSPRVPTDPLQVDVPSPIPDRLLDPICRLCRVIFESCLFLLQTQIQLRFGGLPRIHNRVRSEKVQDTSSEFDNQEICLAMDFACVFFPKRVLCLQRSAATALVLRRHGRSAALVVGAQAIPFKSHAWVEIEGKVVNDKPYTADMYRELQRF